MNSDAVRKMNALILGSNREIKVNDASFPGNTASGSRNQFRTEWPAGERPRAIESTVVNCPTFDTAGRRPAETRAEAVTLFIAVPDFVGCCSTIPDILDLEEVQVSGSMI